MIMTCMMFVKIYCLLIITYNNAISTDDGIWYMVLDGLTAVVTIICIVIRSCYLIDRLVSLYSPEE